jgi:hypothetical protein
MKCYEYKVIDTGKHVEQRLNELGAQGWHVVGVTTKKQLVIAPPQAIILIARRAGHATPLTKTASLAQGQRIAGRRKPRQRRRHTYADRDQRESQRRA